MEKTVDKVNTTKHEWKVEDKFSVSWTEGYKSVYIYMEPATLGFNGYGSIIMQTENILELAEILVEICRMLEVK